MTTSSRDVLLRVSTGSEEPGRPRRLRVHVTLYGMSAAVVEELAEVVERSRSEIVRQLVDVAVRQQTVYEDLDAD